MIIFKDKNIERNTRFPSTNWFADENEVLFIVDETTPEGQALAEKIQQCAPYMDLVIVDGKLVDVTPTERPPAQPAPPTPEEQIATLRERLAIAEQGAADNSLNTQQLIETLIDAGVI